MYTHSHSFFVFVFDMDMFVFVQFVFFPCQMQNERIFETQLNFICHFWNIKYLLSTEHSYRLSVCVCACVRAIWYVLSYVVYVHKTSDSFRILALATHGLFSLFRSFYDNTVIVVFRCLLTKPWLNYP